MGRQPFIQRFIPSRLRESLDWNLLGDSALISAGMAVARALGFAFFLVLARAFEPGGYGVIQYGISLSTVVAVLTMPFGQHVLARFIGKYHDDEEKVQSIITNGWVVMAVLFVLTLVVAVPVLQVLGKFDPGVLIIFMGLTIFYAYWGLARGFMTPVKLIIAYLGSNAVQIVATIVIIQFLDINSTLVALMIYGLSYLLPLTLLQIFGPLPTSFKPRLVNWGMLKELVSFSLPIWLSHASYILYTTIDVLMLEHFTDERTLGIYSLAKTLAMVFFFIPGGISTILMPKVASSPTSSHRRMLFNMLAISLSINIVLLIGYMLFGGWFVSTFFGANYSFDPTVAFVMAVGMIIFGAHSVVTAVLVGRDRARDETISRVLAVLSAGATGWLLIPVQGALGAAIAVLVGAVVGLATYAIIYQVQRPRRPRVLKNRDAPMQ